MMLRTTSYRVVVRSVVVRGGCMSKCDPKTRVFKP
jgi:hypothetical protein